MSILVLGESDLRKALSETDSINVIEQAFRGMADGEVALPGIISLEIPDKHGEVHIKGAYHKGSPYIVFKSSNLYYENPAKGLPVGNGFFVAFDVETGVLKALLFDNSFLTHSRAGAAGALAARHLARKDLRRVAILGCGTQGRFQFHYLEKVRKLSRVVAWDLNPASAEKFKWEIEEASDVDVQVAPDARTAVEGSDCVVTVTPSRQPIVMPEWVAPGAHITGVGADSPWKQEIHEKVFRLADIIIADVFEQCVERGDIHHALKKRTITKHDVTGELGDLVTGRIPGRTSDNQITVCDLTGVGIQDAAIAGLALTNAIQMGLGSTINPQ